MHAIIRMYKPREKVLWFAIVSRVIILILQCIFNLLCPDHYADAFRRPIDDSEEISVYDNVVLFLFSGLTRWDGEYFIHIAKYGYTYENTLAFYPLYPLFLRTVATVINRIFFMVNFCSSLIIAAVIINTICFVKSAVTLYDLSETVLKRKSTAYKAAILFCINPASIFFSAVYSESLFAYLTYYSMLRSAKFDTYVPLPIGLSILARSNGIVNIGFPIYFEFKKLFYNYMRKFKSFSLKTVIAYIFNTTTCKSYCLMCNTIIISVAPFILLQAHNYIAFCIPRSNQTFLPENIFRYGTDNNLILPGSNHAKWCHYDIPIAYSYIQKKYWNVGFLNYYELKQIPNFVLGLPVLYIMITCIKEYFFEHSKYFCTLGLIENIENKQLIEKMKYPSEMLVFVIHGLFLSIFCIFLVHIQVSTRLICSASPLIYWYCALSMSYTPSYDDDRTYENVENMFSKWWVFFLKQKEYTLKDKIILSYFLGYTILGCFMFSNFLPWT